MDIASLGCHYNEVSSVGSAEIGRRPGEGSCSLMSVCCGWGVALEVGNLVPCVVSIPKSSHCGSIPWCLWVIQWRFLGVV